MSVTYTQNWTAIAVALLFLALAAIAAAFVYDDRLFAFTNGVILGFGLRGLFYSVASDATREKSSERDRERPE